MIHSLGGPKDLIEHPTHHLPTAEVIKPVHLESPGYVTSIDTRTLGIAVVELGGGRMRAEDSIDPAVGLSDFITLGEQADRPVAIIHARNEDDWQRAAETVVEAITLSDEKPEPSPVVLESLS